MAIRVVGIQTPDGIPAFMELIVRMAIDAPGLDHFGIMREQTDAVRVHPAQGCLDQTFNDVMGCRFINFKRG